MKQLKYWILTALLLLAVTDLTAQSFKLSAGLREMLTEDATVLRRVADSQSRISLIMKVKEAQQMAQVCADYGMEMVTDLGHIAVVAVPVDQIEKAASDPRVVRMEKEGGFHYCIDKARETVNVNPVTNGQRPFPTTIREQASSMPMLDSARFWACPLPSPR